MTDIATLEVQIKSNTADIKKLQTDLDKLSGKAAKTGTAFGSLASKVKLVGFALAGVAVTKALGQWTDFGEAVSDLSAITGAVGKDLEYLKQQSLDIGATTTLSASQAVTAFKLIASAKPDLLESGEALATVTREAVTLAEAAGLDLPTAANALGASLNQFSKGAEDASRFINVLAAGSKFGASEINLTALALKEAGTVASSAGLSFEETNAAIQALAGVAIKGGQAGTALRNVIVRLQTQSNDQFNPAIVGLSKALQNLGEANLSTGEKAKLFGKLNLASADALIKNADQVEALRGKLLNTDTAYEQASVKVDNLAGDLKRLSSQAESAGLLFGEQFDPALRFTTQTLTALINHVKGAIIAFSNLGDRIGAYAAVAASVLSGDFEQAKIILKLRDEEQKKNQQKYDDLFKIADANKAATEQEAKLIENQKIAAAEQEELNQKRKEAQEIARQAKAEKELESIDEDLTATAERYNTEFDLLNNSLMSQEERLRQSYLNRQFIVEEAFQNGLIADQTRNELLQQLEMQHQAAMGNIEAQGAIAREKFRKKSAKDKIKQVTGELVQLTQGVAQENKTMFKINKAAAIGQAIVDAHTSFNKTMSAYPYPINVGLAAASLAASFAQVKAIKNTQFGAGGSAPSAAGGGVAGGGVSNVTPLAAQAPVREGGASTVINVVHQGDNYGVDDFEEMTVKAIRTAAENDKIVLGENDRNAINIGG